MRRQVLAPACGFNHPPLVLATFLWCDSSSEVRVSQKGSQDRNCVRYKAERSHDELIDNRVQRRRSRSQSLLPHLIADKNLLVMIIVFNDFIL